MADVSYDKSIGTKDRSVVSMTKLWSIVLGIVLLLGMSLLFYFFVSGNSRGSGGPNSENTATRPAEP